MSQRSFRVLLVEDDVNGEELCKKLSDLTGPYFDADWCRTSQEAIKELGGGRYDLVIADWDLSGALPGDTGENVLLHLRRNGYTCDAVLTSARSQLPTSPRMLGLLSQKLASFWDKANLLQEIIAWAESKSLRCALDPQQCRFRTATEAPELDCYVTVHAVPWLQRRQTIVRALSSISLRIDTASDDSYEDNVALIARAKVVVADLGPTLEGAPLVDVGIAIALGRKLVLLSSAAQDPDRFGDATVIRYREPLGKDGNALARVVNLMKPYALRSGRLSGNPLSDEAPSSPSDSTKLLASLQQASKMQHRCLFFAANPRGIQPLADDLEFKAIRLAIDAATHRERFAWSYEGRTAANDLTDRLTAGNPSILHFTGHGTPQRELVLVGADGREDPLDDDRLKRIFKGRKSLRLVVFNACESSHQAEIVKQHVDAVISMSRKIEDESAVAFSAKLYKALADGATLERAFDDAVVAMATANPKDAGAAKLDGNGELVFAE